MESKDKAVYRAFLQAVIESGVVYGLFYEPIDRWAGWEENFNDDLKGEGAILFWSTQEAAREAANRVYSKYEIVAVTVDRFISDTIPTEQKKWPDFWVAPDWEPEYLGGLMIRPDEVIKGLRERTPIRS